MSFSQLHKTIGPYEVLDVIGHGGMATVYRARQPDLDRIVAIKVLLPAFASDSGFRRRFEREARLVASLRHPHIVVIYGVGEEEGMPYLVMEYLEGPTLLVAIQQRRQDGRLFIPVEALELLKPLASALDYAHDHNVIHRDLKPENTILTAHGPVITDFGLAKLLQQEAATVSLVMGTPAYMAPEQIEARPVDRRTDVYALGILLYEMLTGRVPFGGPTPSAVTHAHLHEPAPPLAQLNPRLAALPRLEEVVQRAIAKRQEDRWPSAGALVAALAQAIDAPAATAGATTAVGVQGATPAAPRQTPMPPSRPARLQPPPATGAGRGRLVLLAPLLLLLLIGGLVAARSLRRQAPQAGETGSPAATPAAGAAAPAPPEPTAYRRTVVAGAVREAPSTTAAAPAAAATIPAATAAPAPTATAAEGGSPAVSAPAPNGAVQGVIDAPAGAYLRGGPGAAYPIVAGVRDATAVTVLGRSSDWLDIAAASGERGWVAAALVDIRSGDAASLPLEAAAPPPPVQGAPAPPIAAAPNPARPIATEPRPAPPRPTAPPAARGATVRLEDTNFNGGFRNSGASIYGGRTATWVYGQGSGYSTMAATFNVGAPGPGTATLTIEGMDSEGPAKTPMRVALNGATLYQGFDPLPDDDMPVATGNWGELALQFDAALLNAGANTITITNLAPGPKGLPPFVALDYALVQLP